MRARRLRRLPLSPLPRCAGERAGRAPQRWFALSLSPRAVGPARAIRGRHSGGSRNPCSLRRLPACRFGLSSRAAAEWIPCRARDDGGAWGCLGASFGQCRHRGGRALSRAAGEAWEGARNPVPRPETMTARRLRRRPLSRSPPLCGREGWRCAALARCVSPGVVRVRRPAVASVPCHCRA